MDNMLHCQLNHDQVQVWTVDLERAKYLVGELRQLLSADEIAKSQKFHFEQDRWQYVVCRGLLRKLLGGYLNISPQEILFSYEKYGKPTLGTTHRHGPDLQFNISHSQGFLVMAFALQDPVGIDLEQVKENIDYLAIAQQFFSPTETDHLQRIPDFLQRDAFFNCWTQKEALIKARGDGLSLPLHYFDVSVDPRQEPGLMLFRSSPQEILKWKMYRISIEMNYFCTLAVAGPAKTIRVTALLDSWPFVPRAQDE